MSKQLKVATYSRDKEGKSAKILQCLKNYPEGATPKMIALDTSINVNTVKSMIQKIKGIEKIFRGLYKVVKGGDGAHPSPSLSLFNWNFHNCILSTTLTHHPHKNIQTTISLQLSNLKFEISTKGHATLRLAADNPLNISSISLLSNYFLELISKHSKDIITQKQVGISSIEFNHDYKNIRLDGVKSLSIDNLVEQFKVYQKKQGMRIEHKTKIAFNVENVIDMLQNNPNSLELNIKLANQREQIERLTKATEQNTQLILKMIDNIKKGDID